MRSQFKKTSFVGVAFIFSLMFFGGISAYAQSSASDTNQTSSNGSDGTQVPYTLLSPLPCIARIRSHMCTDSSGNPAITSITLSQFISYAYKFMLALAVVLAVFMITVGGFEYMLSGAANTKGDAVKKIQDAILGLLLALVAYLVLYTIDPNIVSQNNLTIPPITYGSLTNTSATPVTVQSVMTAIIPS